MTTWLQQLAIWDEAAFRAINHGLSTPWLDWLMPWVSDLVPVVPLVLLALWLALAQGRRGLIILAGLLAVFLITDMVSSHLVRPYLARLRPYAALEGIRYLDQARWLVSTPASMAAAGATYGLPSLHAANSLAPAIYLGRFYGPLRWVLLGLALLVGFARVYLGAHYPGDVLAGYAWGWLWGWLAAWAVARVLARRPGLTAGGW